MAAALRRRFERPPDPRWSARADDSLEVARDGNVLALPPSRKARALLAYLVMTGRAHRRERLSALLWDDVGEHFERYLAGRRAGGL